MKGKVCGSFCKKIGPRDQRKIILECLRIETGNQDSGKVILHTETGPEEKIGIQEVTIKCSANKLKKYVLDAKWWAKWCDFTNFDQNDLVLNQLDDRDPEHLGLS
jgi:hypothetical protein